MKRAFLLAVVFAACSPVDDGQPPPIGTSGSTCTNDLDCGEGRHCAAGLCAIDCTSSKDCTFFEPDSKATPTLACSACGRCLKKGLRDDGCLAPGDRPCSVEADCASLGAKWACSASNTCAPRCTPTSGCGELGRGFSCGDTGVCERRCTRDSECWFHGFKWSCALPAGVDGEANARSATPIVGACKAGALSYPAVTKTDPLAARLAGVWGMMLSAAVTTNDIPVLAHIDTVSVSHLLVRVDRDGEGVRMAVKLCTAKLTNFNLDDTEKIQLFKVALPDKNLDAIDPMRFLVAKVDAAGFTTAPFVDLRGATLADPANDPLPTYKDLAKQRDQDHDGSPGLTSNVSGILSGNLYQSQRLKGTISFSVVDDDHLQGPLDCVQDQAVLGSTNPQLVNDSYSVTHAQKDRTYVRMMRLRTEATCTEVIRLGELETGWLAHVPHYDPSQKP